jgi:hypothetical protein
MSTPDMGAPQMMMPQMAGPPTQYPSPAPEYAPQGGQPNYYQPQVEQQPQPLSDTPNDYPTDEELADIMREPIPREIFEHNKLHKQAQECLTDVERQVQRRSQCCAARQTCCQARIVHKQSGVEYRHLMRKLARRMRKLSRRIERRRQVSRQFRRSRAQARRTFARLERLLEH